MMPHQEQAAEIDMMNASFCSYMWHAASPLQPRPTAAEPTHCRPCMRTWRNTLPLSPAPTPSQQQHTMHAAPGGSHATAHCTALLAVCCFTLDKRQGSTQLLAPQCSMILPGTTPRSSCTARDCAPWQHGCLVNTCTPPAVLCCAGLRCCRRGTGCTRISLQQLHHQHSHVITAHATCLLGVMGQALVQQLNCCFAGRPALV